ncbi:MAG: tetratricopeptide repeat protein [Planctomycetota bacterium]|jgi:Flp pilus assembly protein TadD
MKKFIKHVLVVCVFVVSAFAETPTKTEHGEYTGSVSCRSCHEKFYKLWSVSHHGLAMQPYTHELARDNLQPQQELIKIGQADYLAKTGPQEGWIESVNSEGKTKLDIKHVMGGKNVYYFLTSMEKGRLQTLPIAYDIRNKVWFDTAASGVRHFPGHGASQAVSWKDPLYTFNTSCYGCHVSQLSTNYDLETDTYNTVWAEPGINCETCHGPAAEHIKVCQEAPEGKIPEDLKIIITKTFTAKQNNAMCATCHAKQISLSTSFKPGDRYFDHFDLVTLESADYYPEGRDLGENYTMTSWQMSPCVKSGQLDCMHCHTSSGRYRHKDNPNQSCLPCHKKRVENVTEHTRHPAEGQGNKCIECHMPMTDFARMNRSDHSMRPPAPAATIAFKSPNACNLCHSDKDAAWADGYVRKWHKNDYQKTILDTGHLVQAARNQKTDRIDDILNYIQSKERDEIVTASLIRLLRTYSTQKKWPFIMKALQEDPSPLVRASAAESLDGYLTGESLKALLEATKDKYRLVRIRSAASLAGIKPDLLKDETQREDLAKATSEFKIAMNARPDDYTSHYNLGNFYMEQKEYQQAISAFMTSHKLRPNSVLPLNNIAFAYNATGQNKKAEQSFRKVLSIEPGNLVANLNLGMLLGEMGRLTEAVKAFRAAYKADPNSAVAAYNLGVILASTKPKESLSWCKKAYELRPEEGKYGYTYAFYLYQNSDVNKAVKILTEMVNNQVPYADAYMLLGSIHIRNGDSANALDVYRAARDNKKLSESLRNRFGEIIKQMIYD